MEIFPNATVTLKNVDIEYLKTLHEKIHSVQLELNTDSNAWKILEEISPLIFAMWCIANECIELISVENPYWACVVDEQRASQFQKQKTQ